MYCTNCGKELDKDSKFCPNCGSDKETETNSANAEQLQVKNTYICPKCKSNNVVIQAVNESQLITKHHGFFWWLLVGWWWVPFKWVFLTIPALFAAIFIGKRKKIKNITKSKKVCQNCGHTW